VPSIGLGSNAVSPLEMASAYATIAAGGIYSKPMAIRKVVLANGKEDTDAGWGKPQRKRVIPDGVAYTVTKILEQNVLYGTGTRANFGKPAAGKTGTTENHADAWFCGFLPNLEATVWVGYPQGEVPMLNVHGIAVAGGSFPAEIWRRFMEQATRYAPTQDFPLPKTYPTWVDWHQGQYDIAYQSASTSTSTSTTTTTTARPTTAPGTTTSLVTTEPPPTTQQVTVPVQPTTTVPVTTAPPPTTIAPPPTITAPPPPTEPPPTTTQPGPQ
jgi:penicillin-binding protein 1A